MLNFVKTHHMIKLYEQNWKGGGGKSSEKENISK